MIYGEKREVKPGANRVDMIPHHKDLMSLGFRWNGEAYIYGAITVYLSFLLESTQKEWDRFLMVVEQEVRERDRLASWASRIRRYPYADQGGPAAKIIAKYESKAAKLAEQIENEIKQTYAET